MIEKHRKAWLAGLLSFLTIGLGQLYAGKPKKALFLYFIGQGLIESIVLAVIIILPMPILILCSLLVALSFFIYNIYVGDYILAKTKLFIKNNINHGDIVIFKWPKDPSKNFIMRAIALGGDEIKIVDKKVYITGSIINEPYIINEDQNVLRTGDYKTRDNFGPIKVPGDSIFVLGDNRDRSNDSRFWGFVRKSSIVGRANSIYWSWDKSEMSVRWERLGKTIK